jgi:hypothetical protein
MSEKLTALSAEWWDARKRILAGIAKESRKRGVHWTDAQAKRSEAALLCAEGDEDGQMAYERNGFTREQWLAKWFPAASGGAEVSPTERMMALRKAMRGL